MEVKSGSEKLTNRLLFDIRQSTSRYEGEAWNRGREGIPDANSHKSFATLFFLILVIKSQQDCFMISVIPDCA